MEDKKKIGPKNAVGRATQFFGFGNSSPNHPPLPTNPHTSTLESPETEQQILPLKRGRSQTSSVLNSAVFSPPPLVISPTSSPPIPVDISNSSTKNNLKKFGSVRGFKNLLKMGKDEKDEKIEINSSPNTTNLNTSINDIPQLMVKDPTPSHASMNYNIVPTEEDLKSFLKTKKELKHEWRGSRDDISLHKMKYEETINTPIQPLNLRPNKPQHRNLEKFGSLRNIGAQRHRTSPSVDMIYVSPPSLSSTPVSPQSSDEEKIKVNSTSSETNLNPTPNPNPTLNSNPTPNPSVPIIHNSPPLPTPEVKFLSSEEIAKRNKRRTDIFSEIIDTEITYISILSKVVEGFIMPLKIEIVSSGGKYQVDGKPLNSEHISQIFSNIEMICGFNKQLLGELKLRMDSWSPTETLIGDIFLRLTPFLKLYTEYSSNYDKSLDLLKRISKSSPAFKTFLEENRRSSTSSDLSPPLDALIIAPIQRIPRYNLLLRDLIKHTPDSHPDYQNLNAALALMEGVADHINNSLKTSENVQKILAIEKSFTRSNPPPLFAPYRVLVRDGILTQVTTKNKKKALRIFLFNDSLVFARPLLLNKNIFKLQAPILQTFVEDIPNSPTLVFAFKIQTPGKALLVYCQLPDEKTQWMKSINDLRDKQMEVEGARMLLRLQAKDDEKKRGGLNPNSEMERIKMESKKMEHVKEEEAKLKAKQEEEERKRKEEERKKKEEEAKLKAKQEEEEQKRKEEELKRKEEEKKKKEEEQKRKEEEKKKKEEEQKRKEEEKKKKEDTEKHLSEEPTETSNEKHNSLHSEEGTHEDTPVSLEPEIEKEKKKKPKKEKKSKELKEKIKTEKKEKKEKRNTLKREKEKKTKHNGEHLVEPSLPQTPNPSSQSVTSTPSTLQLSVKDLSSSPSPSPSSPSPISSILEQATLSSFGNSSSQFNVPSAPSSRKPPLLPKPKKSEKRLSDESSKRLSDEKRDSGDSGSFIQEASPTLDSILTNISSSNTVDKTE